ncbi:hypothetical protein [Stakelama saccharophila]|uniref:Uncharacterized protein n=1 Tax=Stakelama saccharophila TaxID=3075605 RepID=A0ABZ0B9J5_9SPHN|nr:hypothetical protein [Stakelama sp. W311]WNO54059.1 hypothetical protein RPR59_02025 [Stakelama sp. W311]
MADDGGDDLAVRLVAGGATMLALSTLADSGMEHYRGSFRNPAMVLPLASSSMAIAFNGRRLARPRPGERTGPLVSHLTSTATGLIGLGFHFYNVTKRPGGLGFTNLFYGAPAGAPFALTMAGLFGSVADRLARGKRRLGPMHVTSGRAIGALTSFGLIGTVAEAALLHFRGAYHNPAMWFPVILPPAAAASMARDVIDDTPRAVTTALLGATAAMGLIGAGFHAYGVSRNMGGWKNWRQNFLVGPPVPAPPAFTGIAIAGLGALLLMKRRQAK